MEFMQQFTQERADFGGDVINRLTVAWLMAQLEPEEREILYLWVVEELTFAEIGKVVGLKYRGRELTGSAIRYHKDRIRAKLREHAAAVGEIPPPSGDAGRALPLIAW